MDRDINLYASYRSNNEEWIMGMVRAGIGVALMPEYTLNNHADDIHYRYLSDPTHYKPDLCHKCNNSNTKKGTASHDCRIKLRFIIGVNALGNSHILT